jgi:16S rRNA (guanine527-N7)-methyltransferase
VCRSARGTYNDLRIIGANLTGSTAVSDSGNNVESKLDELRELFVAAGVQVTTEQLALLDHYRRLLWEWNERLNLTRHTTVEKFVGRDVVDSFQLAKLLGRGERVLDVGTGGGVPGVILTILRPDLSISLCESTQKKARAVEAIVADLRLDVSIYATRAEEVLEISTFDKLVARAIAGLPKVLHFLSPHWEAFDELLLIKGPSWESEWQEARRLGLTRGLELTTAAAYQTPETGADNVIVKVRRRDMGD